MLLFDVKTATFWSKKWSIFGQKVVYFRSKVVYFRSKKWSFPHKSGPFPLPKWSFPPHTPQNDIRRGTPRELVDPQRSGIVSRHYENYACFWEMTTFCCEGPLFTEKIVSTRNVIVAVPEPSFRSWRFELCGNNVGYRGIVHLLFWDPDIFWKNINFWRSKLFNN